MPRPNISRCDCGGVATVRSSQVGEDCVETWVECSGCGTHSDYVEDAYSDSATAVSLWNAGKRFPRREEWPSVMDAAETPFADNH